MKACDHFFEGSCFNHHFKRGSQSSALGTTKAFCAHPAELFTDTMSVNTSLFPNEQG